MLLGDFQKDSLAWFKYIPLAMCLVGKALKGVLSGQESEALAVPGNPSLTTQAARMPERNGGFRHFLLLALSSHS